MKRAKYYAWSELENMPKLEAASKYIELVKSIAPDRFHINYASTSTRKRAKQSLHERWRQRVTQELSWTSDEELRQNTTEEIPAEHQINRIALQTYMHDNVPKFSRIHRLRWFIHANSNPTFYVEDKSGAEYVIRKKPKNIEDHIPLEHAIEREFRIMKALKAEGTVPVPTVYCLCLDTTVLGAPFYIMEYVHGRIFRFPALHDMHPKERFLVYQELNRCLVHLHKVNFSKLGLDDFGKSGNYCSRQLKKWREVYTGTK